MIVTAICVVGYIAFGYFFPETGLDNLAPTDRLNLKKIIVKKKRTEYKFQLTYSTDIIF